MVEEPRAPRRYKVCGRSTCHAISLITDSEWRARRAICEACGEPIRLSGVSAATVLWRPTSRREFVAGAFKAATGLAAVITIHREFEERLRGKASEWEELLLRYPKLRDIELQFAETFGLVGPIQSLSLGRDDYPKIYHIDNLAAALSVAGPMGLFPLKPITADAGIDALPDGDLILFGGPNSTPLTKIAWEFEGTDDYMLERRADPLVRLTYYGISNIKGLERVGWIQEGLDGDLPSAVGSYNYPFVRIDEAGHEGRITAEVSSRSVRVKRDGRRERVPVPRDNYLLVTRMPNFLAPHFEEMVRTTHREDWPYLIVFEGTNGVGTRGVELLLTPDGFVHLERLKGSLRGATAFQQMFRLGDIALTPQGFHKFNAIEPWGDPAPIDLSESVCLEAHRRAMRRLNGGP